MGDNYKRKKVIVVLSACSMSTQPDMHPFQRLTTTKKNLEGQRSYGGHKDSSTDTQMNARLISTSLGPMIWKKKIILLSKYCFSEYYDWNWTALLLSGISQHNANSVQMD